jgi:hypothetical protein
MQIFLVFAIFISAIFAVPVPGAGSHIANSIEKHSFNGAERYLDYSINAYTTSYKIKYLGQAKDLIRAIETAQDRRQSLTQRWIDLAKEFPNNDAKVAKLVARKERKAKEFATKMAALDAKEKLALEGIDNSK